MKISHFTRVARFRIIRTNVVVVAVLMVLVSAVANAADCGKGNLRKSREVSLRRTGISVANAIEQRNSAAFLRYVSPLGVGFGVDGVWLYIDDIQRQIKRKEGVYCLLFSTSCIATSDPKNGFKSNEELSKWRISYAEWLGINRPYSTEVELEDDDGSGVCGGAFTVYGRAKVKDTPDSLKLEFIFENGRWMFANTPGS